MKTQISVFTENKKGAMFKITGVLANAGVNIETLLADDGAEFGTVRLVASDAAKAKEALEGAGYLCRTQSVLAVEMRDESGTINRLLADLDESNINIDYLYISYNRESSLPVAVMHTADPDEVESCLRVHGHKTL